MNNELFKNFKKNPQKDQSSETKENDKNTRLKKSLWIILTKLIWAPKSLIDLTDSG